MRKTEKQLTPTPEQTMSTPALGMPQLNIYNTKVVEAVYNRFI
jgi:hypothetical protein